MLWHLFLVAYQRYLVYTWIGSETRVNIEDIRRVLFTNLFKIVFAISRVLLSLNGTLKLKLIKMIRLARNPYLAKTSKVKLSVTDAYGNKSFTALLKSNIKRSYWYVLKFRTSSL